MEQMQLTHVQAQVDPLATDAKLTPNSVLDPVRVFWPDGIDLDPCGHPESLVGARNTIMPPDDGLGADWNWAKTLWCNMPYSRNQVALWLEKLARYEREGNGEALALVKHDHTTRWWHDHVTPRAFCMWQERISFICPQGESAIFPSTIVYFGKNRTRFAEFFSTYGQVVGAVRKKQVKGFSRYWCRSDGEIESACRRKPVLLRGGTDKDGYKRHVLIDDEGSRRYVRRAAMICEAFHGPRPEAHVVRHKDGGRTNDRPSNLAWATQAENLADRHRHGTAPVGERSHRAKVSEREVIEIRSAIARGEPQTKIAARYGMSTAAISCVATGATWASVP